MPALGNKAWDAPLGAFPFSMRLVLRILLHHTDRRPGQRHERAAPGQPGKPRIVSNSALPRPRPKVGLYTLVLDLSVDDTATLFDETVR